MVARGRLCHILYKTQVKLVKDVTCEEDLIDDVLMLVEVNDDVESGEQPDPPQMAEGPQFRRSKTYNSSVRHPSSEYVLVAKKGELKNFQEVHNKKRKV